MLHKVLQRGQWVAILLLIVNAAGGLLAAQGRENIARSTYLSVKYYSSTDTVRPELQFTLVGEVTLPPKMHVYTPEVKGYIPIEWKIEDSPNYTAKRPDYPKGKLFMFPEINEVVPVYENTFRITQDVVMASSTALQSVLKGDKTIRIRGGMRYQACDDKVCYPPQVVPMEWTLRVEPPASVAEPAPRKALP